MVALVRTVHGVYRTIMSTGYKQSETTNLVDAPDTSSPSFVNKSLTHRCHKQVLKICSDKNFAWPKHMCTYSQAMVILRFINHTRTSLEVLWGFGRHKGQAMCLSSIHTSSGYKHNILWNKHIPDRLLTRLG